MNGSGYAETYGFSGASADSTYTGHIWRTTGIEICAGDSLTLVADFAQGGANPAFQWYVNGSVRAGATDTVFGYRPNDGDIVLCRIINTNCGDTTYSFAMIITAYPVSTDSVSIISENNVCAGTSVTFTATAFNGGTPTYEWFVNDISVSSGTSNTYTYQPANNDVIICKMTSSDICAKPRPAISDPVTMVINPIKTPSITIKRIR